MNINWKPKLLVVADSECLFLPNLVAKLACDGLVQSIVIRRPKYFAGNALKNAVLFFRAFGFGVLLSLGIANLVAIICDKICRNRYYSLEKVARNFDLPLFRVGKIHSDQFYKILEREGYPAVFFQCSVKLKRELLDKTTFINRHCGLLPTYAGVNPVFWALLNGEKELGVTLHIVNENYDEGSILSQARIDSRGHTFFSAYHRLFDLVAELFPDIFKNKFAGKKQTTRERSYFSWHGAAERRRFYQAGKKFGFAFRFHPEIIHKQNFNLENSKK